MRLQSIARTDLANRLPPFLATRTFIALVPLTDDLGWAARTAWDVARTAARSGKRVALVDLFLDRPQLHEAVEIPREAGIVEAFARGDTLTDVAQARPERGLYFVQAGLEPVKSAEIFESGRWQALHAGFRQERALLFTFLSLGSLARIAATPEGVLVLAPAGYNRKLAPVPALEDLLEQGSSMVSTVFEQAQADTVREGKSKTGWVQGFGNRAARMHSRYWSPAAMVGTVLVVTIGALGIYLLRGGVLAGSQDRDHTSGGGVTEAAATSVETARPFARDAAWVVQVATVESVEEAARTVRRLEATGAQAIVAPIAFADHTIWYRVLIGPYAAERGATNARTRLWRSGTVEDGTGDLVQAPYSFELAADAVGAARATGLEPFRYERRLLIGAFETPEQASIARDMLTEAALTPTLVTRMRAPE